MPLLPPLPKSVYNKGNNWCWCAERGENRETYVALITSAVGRMSQLTSHIGIYIYSLSTETDLNVHALARF